MNFKQGCTQYKVLMHTKAPNSFFLLPKIISQEYSVHNIINSSVNDWQEKSLLLFSVQHCTAGNTALECDKVVNLAVTTNWRHTNPDWFEGLRATYRSDVEVMVLVGKGQEAIVGQPNIAEGQRDHIQLVAEDTRVTNLPPRQCFKHMDT